MPGTGEKLPFLLNGTVRGALHIGFSSMQVDRLIGLRMWAKLSSACLFSTLAVLGQGGGLFFLVLTYLDLSCSDITVAYLVFQNTGTFGFSSNSK